MTTTPEIAGRASEVLEQHRPRLLEILRRRIDPTLESRADAEDILQQTFLRAEERWEDRPDGMTPFRWLYRIAMNCLCDEWRRHNRVNLGGLKREVLWPDQSSLQLAGSFTSPSEAMARKERIERVHKVLEALSEEDGKVLTMRIIEGLTFQEMGEVLEVNLNRAAYLFTRAMRRFKEVWQVLDRGGNLAP
jgi:RNA polymerase sigma-70 factor (ECF subfamily)